VADLVRDDAAETAGQKRVAGAPRPAIAPHFTERTPGHETYDGVEEVVVNAEVVEGRAQPLIIYAERRDKGGAA